MRARARARTVGFCVGLALGYRLGNVAAVWYLRARGRGEQAELARVAGAIARAGGRAA